MPLKNAVLVKEFMVRARTPDRASLAHVMASDCRIVQSSIHPYAGIFEGLSGAADFFSIIHGTYKITRLDLIDLFENEDGSVLVLEFMLEGSVRNSGAQISTTVMEQWKVANGKIVEIKPHWFDPPGHLARS